MSEPASRDDPASVGPVGRALAVLRDEGAGSFWMKLVGELGYRRVVLQELRLDQPMPELTPSRPVRIELLDESALDDYLDFRSKGTRDGATDLLRSGDLCLLARLDGRIVSCCWSSTRRARIRYLEFEIDLVAGDAYRYDAYTLPAFRGRGVATAICLEHARLHRRLGSIRLLRTAAPENKASMRLGAAIGFRSVELIGRIGVGTWQRRFRRPITGRA